MWQCEQVGGDVLLLDKFRSRPGAQQAVAVARVRAGKEGQCRWGTRMRQTPPKYSMYIEILSPKGLDSWVHFSVAPGACRGLSGLLEKGRVPGGTHGALHIRNSGQRVEPRRTKTQGLQSLCAA